MGNCILNKTGIKTFIQHGKKLQGDTTSIKSSLHRYEKFVKILESQRVSDSDALCAISSEVDAFTDSVRNLVADLECDKASAVEADSVLANWEDKVRAARETHSVVSAERGRDGEVETMRGMMP